MAFVNKKLTKEEREEFKARKLIDFKRTNPGHIVYADPYIWTIDEERGVILVPLGTPREEYYNKYFIFFIGDTIANMILTYKYQPPYIITWSIKKIDFKNENTIPEEKFFELLKQALTEFRRSGDPDENYNRPAEVKFEF